MPQRGHKSFSRLVSLCTHVVVIITNLHYWSLFRYLSLLWNPKFHGYGPTANGPRGDQSPDFRQCSTPP